MVPCGLESFAVDTEFAGFVLFEQVKGDAVEHGEVLRGVTGAFAAEVFAEGYIEHPVQFVFDAPVLSNESIQPCGVRRKTGEVITRAGCFKMQSSIVGHLLQNR